MFDLGFKQIVLNGDSEVKDWGGTIEVRGLTTFPTPLTADSIVFKTPATRLIAGVETIDVDKNNAGTADAFLEAGVSYSVYFYYATGNDSYGTGKTPLMFLQTGKIATNTAVDFYAALQAAYDGAGADFNQDIVLSGGNTVTFDKGCKYLVKVLVRKDNSCLDCPEEVTHSIFKAVTTAECCGSGSGIEVEAEVQNSTMANLDPWASRASDTVDIRGWYHLYYIETSQDHDGGWEPHEMRGYGDANTEATYARRKYAIYLNENAVAAAAILDTLIAGATFTRPTGGLDVTPKGANPRVGAGPGLPNGDDTTCPSVIADPTPVVLTAKGTGTGSASPAPPADPSQKGGAKK